MDIILGEDIIAPLNPSKTVFVVGAGISAGQPSSLPLGNTLTRAYLNVALGYIKSEQFINFWTERFPKIEKCVHGNTWEKPSYASIAKVYPRLEFVVGELDKLDRGFREIKFRSELLRKKYDRGSSISAISIFSSAEPNPCHYWLAEYTKAGSKVITPNFDVCIEKALGADLSHLETLNGMQSCNGVYHYHGISTDPNLEVNLGITIKNISKGFPRRFKEEIKGLFQSGYDVVFLGYSGLDLFDALPFFEELKSDGGYSGRAIYVKHTEDDNSLKDALDEDPKPYQYLLDPFNNQYVVYGRTMDFLKVTAGIIEPKPVLHKDVMAFEHVVEELRGIERRLESIDENTPGLEALDTYHFINMMRLCSQLTINPGHFYPDFDRRIKRIINEWEADNPENLFTGWVFTEEIRSSSWETRRLAEIKRRLPNQANSDANELMSYLPICKPHAPEAMVEEYVERTVMILEQLRDKGVEPTEEEALIEQALIHYLCGYKSQVPMLAWIIFRRPMRSSLRRKQEQITKLTTFEPTLFTYRTFYLALCRVKDLLDTMLDEKEYHGDLEKEWQTCMRIPDLLDAEKKIRNLIHQSIVLMGRGRLPDLRKCRELRAIRNELRLIKREPMV